MNLFLKEPPKIRARIRQYERQLRKEQEEFGAIDDSYGKRYLLGPLYMLMGDTEGALQSFAWFDKTFSDDSGDPMHLLCWTLALYRSGDVNAAQRKLRQTMFSNLYIIPYLLKLEQTELDIWHWSNIAELEHLEYIPSEIFALWDEASIQWAHETYEAPDIRRARERFIEIYRLLNTEPRGPKRTALVQAASTLVRGK